MRSRTPERVSGAVEASFEGEAIYFEPNRVFAKRHIKIGRFDA